MTKELFAMAIVLSITGCVHRAEKTTATLNSQNGFAANEEISAFQSQLSEARTARLDEFSPGHFVNAEEALAKAERIRQSNGAPEKSLAEIRRGQAELSKAENVAASTKNILASAIAARDEAIASGAGTLKNFRVANQQFGEAARAIERNDLKFAEKKAPQLAQRFEALRTEAIETHAFSTADQNLMAARQEKADRLVPKTLKFTEARLQQLRRAIASNPNDKEQVRKLNEEAVFLSRRLLVLTREAWEIQKQPAERAALWIERSLKKIRQPFDLPDIGDQPFEAQIDQIDIAAEQVKKDRDSLAEQNRNLMAQLDAEKRASAMVDQIHSTFRPVQASVRREGDEVILVLNDLRFTGKQKTLPPASRRSLAKVHDLVQSTGTSHIIIQSQAPAKRSVLNEELMRQRAEAIKSFLVSQRTLPPEKIDITSIEANTSKDKRNQKSALGGNIQIVFDVKPQG